jgi:hypothetical protein
MCVVPRELESDLFDPLVERYKDNPGVTVIVDRRFGGSNDRRRGASDVHDERRVIRDRRRPRAIGTFPRVADDAA